MKHLQFDYGQPLAIVALMLVLSTAFAFFEDPISPPADDRKMPGTNLTNSLLPTSSHGKMEDGELRLDAGDTPDAVNEQRESSIILAEDK